jgi:hypothetical protein
MKISCANEKNAKRFGALAFHMQNYKFSVELSWLKISNSKLKMNLKVKLFN